MNHGFMASWLHGCWRDVPIVELRGNNCRVGEVVIFGGADSREKEYWKNSVMSGMKVSGCNNVVGALLVESVHVPYISTGEHNDLISLRASYFSGDGFNLCGDFNTIMKAEIKSGLMVYDYDVYHRDVGMMFKSGGGLLSGCSVYNLSYSEGSHPWECPRIQGVLIDGKSLYCRVYNFDVRGRVHSEHGVSFADAEACEVMNVRTLAAVNWDKKSESRDDRCNVKCGGWS